MQQDKNRIKTGQNLYSHPVPILFLSCSRLVFSYLVLFLLCFSSAYADEVEISASVEENTAIAKRPISGMISVTHDKQLKIDTNAFKMEGKALAVEALREDNIQELTISFFRFKLDPKPPGLYLLPPITVTINGKRYTSIQSSYEVHPAIQTAPTTAISTTPIFRLESFFQGPSPFYPGERGFIIYRISYNMSVELSRSDLPLLKQEDFRKIGDISVIDSQEGDLSVQEIKQEVEAIKPGTFTYGPSIIEGYSKEMASQEKLRAEAPKLIIVVAPLPEQKIPPSYSNGIGEFTMKASLLTPQNIYVGDAIEVGITITGKGNIDDLKLPNLVCQPGISGIFRLDDLPPAGSIEGSTKHFIVKMKAQSPFIKAVPSLEFAYFNPTTHQYVRLHTEPLPLSVKPLSGSINEPVQQVELAMDEWRQSLTQLPPIEIKPNVAVGIQDLKQNPLKTAWVLLLIPVGFLLLWGQTILRDKIQEWKKLHAPAPSQTALQKALLLNDNPDMMLQGINKAFLLKMKEMNGIEQVEISPEDIPPGIVKDEVRDYLLKLEAIRFGHSKEFSTQEVAKKAQSLFKILENRN